MDKKLAIVCSHPIQYYAPMFRYWSKSINLEVIYCHTPSPEEIGKQGFGISFEWDLDLLSGYKSVFIKNVSKNPAMDSFNGCDTPSIGAKIKEIKATHVLIMGWYLKSYLQAYIFCILNHIPSSVRGDSQLDPNDSFIKDKIKRLIYPIFFLGFNKILYVGNRNKAYLKHYGAKNEQLLFSPHAVDQDFWSISSKFENVKSTEKTIFIWVGKFTEKKRPQDIIDVFKKIESNQVELWMVGTGELLEKSKQSAKSDERITFLGFKNQTELRDLYQNVDCIILTSDYRETWGLVINEAFSNGIPAIVCESCGCSEDLIIEGKTGYIYKKNDFESLQRSIMYIHQSKINLENSFQENITEINKKYNFQASLPALISFING